MSPRLLAAVLVFAMACGPDQVLPAPDLLTVAIAAGDGQAAIGKTDVAVAPAVRVTDADGAPRAGVMVRFEVTEGGGSATETTVPTDGSGVARVGSWQLGPPNVQQRLTAFVPLATNQAVVFSASAITGPFHTFDLDLIVNESPVGELVPSTLSVLTTDIAGNPVAGVPIRWTIDAGSGVLGNASPMTGSDGRATASGWVLGTTAGLQRVWVQVDLPQYVNLPWMRRNFDVRAAPGPVASIEKLASDTQVAQVGSATPEAPRVRLRDRYGNLAYPRQVVFTVLSGGGTVDNTHQIAAADGTAKVGTWRLGTTPGENRLRVTADTMSTEFVATAIP
jgi:hypothetical protein